MKILLVAWNRLGRKKKGNWNHELFRRELARQHDVVFFGVGYKGYNNKLTIPDVLEKHPDINVVLTHYEYRDKALAPGLEDVKNILKVHIMGGDYDKSSFKGYDAHFHKVNYDIIFPRYSLQTRTLKEHNIGGKHYLLPFSVDINKHYKQKIEKTIDVLAAFQVNQRVHPNRRKIRGIVSKMDVNSFLQQAWFEEYVKKINESKIFVTSNVKEGELSGKYTEVMACGTFLLTTRPEDLHRLGYKNEEHLVLYKNDFSDLEDKIEYFLKHENEREEIAKNGMEFVRRNHSSEVRVKEFTGIIMRNLQWIKSNI